MQVEITGLPLERLYITGALFAAYTHMDMNPTWWHLHNLPIFVWKTLAWPYYLPLDIVSGFTQAPLVREEEEEGDQLEE
jgi:hypothetical protein